MQCSMTPLAIRNRFECRTFDFADVEYLFKVGRRRKETRGCDTRLGKCRGVRTVEAELTLAMLEIVNTTED
jgi:hypothetical protein